MRQLPHHAAQIWWGSVNEEHTTTTIEYKERGRGREGEGEQERERERERSERGKKSIGHLLGEKKNVFDTRFLFSSGLTRKNSSSRQKSESVSQLRWIARAESQTFSHRLEKKKVHTATNLVPPSLPPFIFSPPPKKNCRIFFCCCPTLPEIPNAITTDVITECFEARRYSATSEKGGIACKPRAPFFSPLLSLPPKKNIHLEKSCSSSPSHLVANHSG